MTDREQDGLRGPVQECAVERDILYPDHHWVMRTAATFSKGGNLLEQRHLNPDGSQCSIIYRYDLQGRISQKEQRGLEAVEVFSYHYDALGRLERVTARPETGDERVCESYHYDPAGQKAVTAYPDPALRGRADVGVGIEAAFEISIEASSILTIFDERDRPVKRVFYDPNGRVDRRILMRYDVAGRLVEEGEHEADGNIREDLRNLYRYDAAGRLVEKTMYRYAFGTCRKAFAYNDQGDLIEERNHGTAGLIDQFGDQDWTTLYRHQYDDRGNWIERVAETVLPSGEPGVSTVERRRLNYY